MSAELLREAAALMRERAEATFSDSEPSGAWYAVSGMKDALDMCGDDVRHRQDAEHIASWHPAVALAVADWLDGAADMDAAVDENCRCWRCLHIKAALATARAYLGDSA